MKNIILMAPIAAGKGTQSKMLVSEFGYVQISTGEIFREIIATGSELGNKLKEIIDSGNLIDDEFTIKLVNEKLEEIGDRPFILDGFPRNLHQAEVLNRLLDDKGIDYHAIYLDIDVEIAKKRTLGRLICDCGASYNVNYENLKPKQDGICDDCGGVLKKRSEDNEEAFNKRYSNLMNNLMPVLEVYKNIGKLSVIDASKDVFEIFSDIKEEVTNDKYKESKRN